MLLINFDSDRCSGDGDDDGHVDDDNHDQWWYWWWWWWWWHDAYVHWWSMLIVVIMVMVVRVIAIVINNGWGVDDDDDDEADDDDCGVGDDVIVDVNGDFLVISRSSTKEGKVASHVLPYNKHLSFLHCRISNHPKLHQRLHPQGR